MATGTIKVSKSRYESPEYVIKPNRYKYLKPIIIANWQRFEDTNQQIILEYSRIERHDLRKIFETLLHKFGIKQEECHRFYNLSKADLMSRLNAVARGIPRSGSSRPDMLLCFILVRGKHHYFYDIPEYREMSDMILLSDIMHIFNAECCPGLIMRPKLFLVQNEWKPKRKRTGEFIGIIEDPNIRQGSIPVESDFCTYISTELADAFNWDQPSTFIQILCEEIKTCSGDIQEIIRNVNKRIKAAKDEDCIPVCTSQLTKQMTFVAHSASKKYLKIKEIPTQIQWLSTY